MWPAAAIYDEFRLIGLAARAAAAKGSTINPEAGLADLKGFGMVVVAYPYRCEERLLMPLGLALHAQTGNPIPRAQMAELSADQISRILPGVVMPEGAKAYGYQLA